MRFFQHLLTALSLSAMCGLASFAQDVPETDAESTPVENRYRIGIDCVPISEPLQVHLNLDQGTGLMVNSVMDDSPAAKAGLRRLDVIVATNERPVGSVMDLVRAVNEARESELAMEIIRRGEEMQLRVTPEERDEEEIQRIRRGFRNRLRDPAWGGFRQLPPEIQRQLERLGPLEDMIGPEGNWPGGAFGWRRILPGIMMDDSPQRPLPDGFNFNLQVERTEDGPAKIKVQQGDKAWEVTEDNLDELPEDVRGMVENMLNGSGGSWSGLMVPNQRPALRPPARRAEKDETQMRKRFDGLELQIQELQDAIRSLKEDN